uniref:Uncharacterized protein n=1 Tax=Strongyloides papillosus TaxID=174720 RepID=A0A0N5CHW7_STREA
MLLNKIQHQEGTKLFCLTFFTFPYLYYFFRHISDDETHRIRNSTLSTSIVIFFIDIMEGRMERNELKIVSILTFVLINITGYMFEYLILENNMILSFDIILSLSSCVRSIY